MNTTSPVKTVLIIEDEMIVARHVQRVLEKAGFRVPGCASSAGEALEQFERYDPDLVVMDVSLKGAPDGIEVARTLSASRAVPIVYLTARHDEETLQRASATNAVAYLLKPFDERQLCTTVKVAAARAAMPSQARRRRLEQGLVAIARVIRDLGLDAPHSGWESRLDDMTLSKREIEVVRHLASGGRVPSIARTLGLSPHTVRNHLKAAFRKLNVHSQDELIEWIRNN
jgi:DNA-binding NarL/FixJ family response regulator